MSRYFACFLVFQSLFLGARSGVSVQGQYTQLSSGVTDIVSTLRRQLLSCEGSEIALLKQKKEYYEHHRANTKERDLLIRKLNKQVMAQERVIHQQYERLDQVRRQLLAQRKNDTHSHPLRFSALGFNFSGIVHDMETLINDINSTDDEEKAMDYEKGIRSNDVKTLHYKHFENDKKNDIVTSQPIESQLDSSMEKTCYNEKQQVKVILRPGVGLPFDLVRCSGEADDEVTELMQKKQLYQKNRKFQQFKNDAKEEISTWHDNICLGMLRANDKDVVESDNDMLHQVTQVSPAIHIDCLRSLVLSQVEVRIVNSKRGRRNKRVTDVINTKMSTLGMANARISKVKHMQRTFIFSKVKNNGKQTTKHTDEVPPVCKDIDNYSNSVHHVSTFPISISSVEALSGSSLSASSSSSSILPSTSVPSRVEHEFHYDGHRQRMPNTSYQTFNEKNDSQLQLTHNDNPKREKEGGKTAYAISSPTSVSLLAEAVSNKNNLPSLIQNQSANVTGMIDDAHNGILSTDSNLTHSNTERQDSVVRAFEWAWVGYQLHAWGRDELKPLSRKGQDWFGMGMCIKFVWSWMHIANCLCHYIDLFHLQCLLFSSTCTLVFKYSFYMITYIIFTFFIIRVSLPIFEYHEFESFRSFMYLSGLSDELTFVHFFNRTYINRCT